MDNLQSVPYVVYESAETRSERHIKRLIIALIITVFLMFISNALWLWAWCQYDYTSEEVSYTQDSEGLNTINTGTQGDVVYEPETEDKETKQE
jgi:hypothetical protein